MNHSAIWAIYLSVDRSRRNNRCWLPPPPTPHPNRSTTHCRPTYQAFPDAAWYTHTLLVCNYPTAMSVIRCTSIRQPVHEKATGGHWRQAGQQEAVSNYQKCAHAPNDWVRSASAWPTCVWSCQIRFEFRTDRAKTPRWIQPTGCLWDIHAHAHTGQQHYNSPRHLNSDVSPWSQQRILTLVMSKGCATYQISSPSWQNKSGRENKKKQKKKRCRCWPVDPIVTLLGSGQLSATLATVTFTAHQQAPDAG